MDSQNANLPMRCRRSSVAHIEYEQRLENCWAPQSQMPALASSTCRWTKVPSFIINHRQPILAGDLLFPVILITLHECRRWLEGIWTSDATCFAEYLPSSPFQKPRGQPSAMTCRRRFSVSPSVLARYTMYRIRIVSIMRGSLWLRRLIVWFCSRAERPEVNK